MENNNSDKVIESNKTESINITGLEFCKPLGGSSDMSLSDEYTSDDQPDERNTTSENKDYYAAGEDIRLSSYGISNGNVRTIAGLDQIRHIGEPNLPKITLFTRKLIELVDRARNYDTGYRAFGADHHHYEFNPVASLSDVRDFEKRHQISFPKSYVDYLTQVGNGGAGPDLGLYSLDEVEYNNYTDHCGNSCTLEQVRYRSDFHTVSYTIPGKEPLVTSGLDEDKWFQWYEDLGRMISEGKNFRAKSAELYNGLVEISSMGGTNAIFLICNGDLKGRLAAFTFDIDDRVHIFDVDFEEWIINHFQRIVDKFDSEKK